MTFSDAGLNAVGYPSPSIEYHLPPLDDLFANNIANVSLDRLTGGHRGPDTYPGFNLWMNFVRLTDPSLQRYEVARSSLALYRAEVYDHHVSPFYEAINCLRRRWLRLIGQRSTAEPFNLQSDASSRSRPSDRRSS